MAATAYFSAFLTLVLTGYRKILYLAAKMPKDFSIVYLAQGKTLVEYLLRK